MKLLIIMPSWIGDAIMCQPLLRRLQEQHSAITIDAVASQWIAPVVSRMPEVCNVINSPLQHGRLNWKAIRKTARLLSNHGYDEAIILPNSFKSALLPWLAGIAVRKGFLGEYRWGLLNHITRPDPKKQGLLVKRYLMLADNSTYPIAENDAFSPPSLISKPSDQTAVLSAFGIPQERAMVALCPGAEYGPAKQWPIHHFAALTRLLVEKNMFVCLLGSPKDRSIAEKIQETAAVSNNHCINLCGETSLDQAIDLLAAAHTAVTNDSGLMHIAAALNTKTIALYGSSDPTHTPPLSDRAIILRQAQPCSPCFQRQCPFNHYQCLEAILPDRVLSAILSEHPSFPDNTKQCSNKHNIIYSIT